MGGTGRVRAAGDHAELRAGAHGSAVSGLEPPARLLSTGFLCRSVRVLFFLRHVLAAGAERAEAPLAALRCDVETPELVNALLDIAESSPLLAQNRIEQAANLALPPFLAGSAEKNTTK